MYCYSLYGLKIATPIFFPEVPEAKTFEPAYADACMSFAAPPDWVLAQYREGRFSHISRDAMWFRLYEEVLIYVEGGRDVRILKLDPSIAESRLHTYILSGAMTFLLLQRGYIPIHGSAVSLGNKVYIISGPSGSGKSTTALELLQSPGFLFASDDICAVRPEENQALLYPGPPWQRVCRDVAGRYSEYAYTPIEEQDCKFGRRLTDGFLTAPAPVGGMFILSKQDCPAPQLTPLTGEPKFQALTHNLFRGELHHLLGLTPEKMLQLFALTNSFPIYELKRPAGQDTLARVCGLIQEEIRRLH